MAGYRKANGEREVIFWREEELVDLSKVPNRDMRCLPLYHGSGLGAIKGSQIVSLFSIEPLKYWESNGSGIVVEYKKLDTQGGRPAKLA